MSINEFKDNLKLYCVYHDKKFISEYKLDEDNNENLYYEPIVENSWFKPYYTKEGHENSLDNIQDIVNEFTAMVYVYKNNLYSKYVGFCHYDRQQLKEHIENDDIDLNQKVWYYNNDYLIRKNFIHYIYKKYNGFLFKDFIKYISKSYKRNSRIYKVFFGYNNRFQIQRECYICEWKYFCEIVECIYNFICYLNDKYNLEWNSYKYKEFIKNNFNTNYRLPECLKIESNQARMFGYIIEIILGYYLGSLKIELENNINNQ